METVEDKYVTVAYKLYTTGDGKRDLVGEITVGHPSQFISGLDITLEVSESQTANLSKGDKFEFTIPFAEVYGKYDEEHAIGLPENILEIGGKLDSGHTYPGNIIPLMNSEGQRPNGSIAEAKADIVVIDMNHPLAGEDLIFAGEVVKGRPAIDEEIQEMVKMMTGEGGYSYGSCGDGRDDNCGDGCGGSYGCGHYH